MTLASGRRPRVHVLYVGLLGSEMYATTKNSKASNQTTHLVNVHDKKKLKTKHQDTQERNKPLRCEYCQTNQNFDLF